MESIRLDRRRFLAGLGLGAAAVVLPRRARGLGADSVVELHLADDADRPEYHLLAPHNWMNDPNGPIWWKGKYHLYYQLNPGAAVWGDMHWGHAVSADMVHWRHEAIALAPTPGGHDSEGCFSGSAVVYKGVPTLIYTGVQNAPPEQVTIHDSGGKLRETQLLATAEDDTLRAWKKLPEPVIALPPAGMAVTGFRDPCPWREADGWYMVVGSGERGKGGCALLYRSQDLRHWEYLHPLATGKPNAVKSDNPNDTGEMWECPDFFEVNGQHCLLYSAEGKVFWNTGEYDRRERRFTVKRQGLLDHGAFYAPKSFLAPGGRRILWGWIQERRPEAEFARAGWAGAMSLPRELTIDAEGRLGVGVAAEVKSLRGTEERATIKLKGSLPGTVQNRKQTLTTLRREIEVRLPGKAAAVNLRLNSGGKTAWEISLDGPAGRVTCGEATFALPELPASGVALRLFLDGSVLESLVCGREAVTSRVYGLKPGEAELEIEAQGTDGVEIVQWPLGAISTDRLTA